MGTFHRHNDFYNVQTVYSIPTQPSQKTFCIFVFLKSKKSCFPHGDQKMSPQGQGFLILQSLYPHNVRFRTTHTHTHKCQTQCACTHCLCKYPHV